MRPLYLAVAAALAIGAAGCVDATDPAAELPADAAPGPDRALPPDAAPEADAAPDLAIAPAPDAAPAPAPSPIGVDGTDPEGTDLTPPVEPEPEPEPEPDPGPPHVNTLDQDRLFACDGTPGASEARIRRIEAFEWKNAIHSESGGRVPLQGLAEHHYSTYSADETIDAPTLDEYLRYSHIPGNGWNDQGNNGNPRLLVLRGEHKLEGLRCFQWNWNNQPVTADPDDACIESYVRVYLEHGVLFRPPTDDEVARLVAFARSQVEREVADDFDRRDTIRLVSQAAWLMASAVFRSEVGVEIDDGRRMLTDDEIASALSLALNDHVAGLAKAGYVSDGYDSVVHHAAIEAAVAEGTISHPDVIADIVRRTLAGTDMSVAEPDTQPSDYPQGWTAFHDEHWTSPKLRRFFREWLGYANVQSIFKDHPEATSAFEAAKPGARHRYRTYVDRAQNGADLANYLDAIIARVVARDSAVLAELLTTREYLVPPITGDDWYTDQSMYAGFMYNYDLDDAAPIQGDAPERWLALPDDERAGFLTHPAWLGAHGGNFENDPSAIHRGKWVYEELLCAQVPPLPINVDAQLDPATAGDSARHRLETQLDARPECNGCHVYMNPLGYAFETYNHAGYLRVEDHGAPPDGSTRLVVVPPGDPVITPGLELRDAVDLAEHLARSPRVKRCFIRQSFRYFMGRDETYADACTLEQMEQAYDGTDGSMIEMIVTLFQSDAFLYRQITEPAGALEGPEDMEAM